MTGFTGVVWEARAAQRLSRELSAGAGARPLFEAGMSWAAIAASVTELHLELENVSRHLADSWHGESAGPMNAALVELRKWLSDTAEMASRTAAAAERQAVANSVAVAAMPDSQVVDQLESLEQTISALAFPAGSMLGGGLAKVETATKTVKAQASRVMESYETATTPVARPWAPAPAPQHLVRRSAPGAEKARADAERAAAAAEVAAMGGQQGMLAQIAAMAATPLGQFRSEQYVTKQNLQVETVAAADTETVVAAQSAGTLGQGQMIPAAPMASAAASPTQHTASALNLASNYDTTNTVAATDGQVASPSVIGASESEAS